MPTAMPIIQQIAEEIPEVTAIIIFATIDTASARRRGLSSQYRDGNRGSPFGPLTTTTQKITA
jgi:NADPH-dependent ferric siderophore reductase